MRRPHNLNYERIKVELHKAATGLLQVASTIYLRCNDEISEIPEQASHDDTCLRALFTLLEVDPTEVIRAAPAQWKELNKNILPRRKPLHFQMSDEEGDGHSVPAPQNESAPLMSNQKLFGMRSSCCSEETLSLTPTYCTLHFMLCRQQKMTLHMLQLKAEEECKMYTCRAKTL